MIWPHEIELIKSKFEHHDKLLLIYIYDIYVFGIVTDIIPDLRLPQVTVDEMERCLRTDGGESKLVGLLAARCIFTPDQSREIKITEALKDDSFYESVITRDEISKLIREEIATIHIPLAEATKRNEDEIQVPTLPPIASSAEKAKSAVGSQLSILDQVSLNLKGD